MTDHTPLPSPPEPKKFAYADPPYLGCCGMYGHQHEPWGCWDHIATHVALLRHLKEFDGWAYSLTSTSLPEVLMWVNQINDWKPSGVRIASWVKPFAAFKANVRIAYTWEPVLFVPGRDSSKDGAPVGRDHLSEPITMQKGLTGAKPEKFCRWIANLLGLRRRRRACGHLPWYWGHGPSSRSGSAAVTDPTLHELQRRTRPYEGP